MGWLRAPGDRGKCEDCLFCADDLILIRSSNKKSKKHQSQQKHGLFLWHTVADVGAHDPIASVRKVQHKGCCRQDRLLEKCAEIVRRGGNASE